MTLLERIEDATRDAMRARDSRRTQTLRMALAAAHNRKIELRRDLTDDEVVDVLGRQVKQRREASEIFRSAGRADRADDEDAEAAIIGEFMPAQLDAAALEEMARAAIAASDASSPADMGRVMGRLVPQVKGRADGRAVSELVRRMLTEGRGA
jgi:uncharacterized protein YqeY